MCLALPGKIISIEKEGLLECTGNVLFGCIIRKISLAFLPEARVGQYVLVHIGVAISILDEDRAKEIFNLLEEIENEIR